MVNSKSKEFHSVTQSISMSANHHHQKRWPIYVVLCLGRWLSVAKLAEKRSSKLWAMALSCLRRIDSCKRSWNNMHLVNKINESLRECHINKCVQNLFRNVIRSVIHLISRGRAFHWARPEWEKDICSKCRSQSVSHSEYRSVGLQHSRQVWVYHMIFLVSTSQLRRNIDKTRTMAWYI